MAIRASLQDETRVRDAGYVVEPIDGSTGHSRIKGWVLLDIGDRAPLMIGGYGCVAPTKADAIAEGLRRIEDDTRHAPAAEQTPVTLKVWEDVSVPPVYAPPISEDVARCAQTIAGRFLQSDRRADLRTGSRHRAGLYSWHEYSKADAVRPDGYGSTPSLA